MELRTGERLARIPGVALVYTNTYTGIPAAFTNMLANMPALHEVVVFITVRCEGVAFLRKLLVCRRRVVQSLPFARPVLHGVVPGASLLRPGHKKTQPPWHFL